MPLQYRVNWNAGGSNPGVTVFNGRTAGGSTTSQAAQDLANATRLLFDGLKATVPAAITWTFSGEVTELDTSTGALIGVHPVTVPAQVVATGGGTYALPAGARIEWRTDAIVAGRRLRGRSFIVPLTVSGYDAQGSLAAATLTTLNAAADAYRAHAGLANINPAVWSRTHGIQADITSHVIVDEAAVLRSRRD